MATMPFTPCPAVGPCTDVSVGMLERIFGPVIPVMTQGLDPSTVTAAGHFLPTLFTFFNSGILVVGALIVTYIALVGAANTANDGEVLGKSWSSMWTPLRIVFSGGLLLPTTSGYSAFQLITLLMSLWAVGFGNGVYNLGTTFNIFTPPDLVYTPNSNADFYGLRDVGSKYLKVAMCERSANAIFANPVSNPGVGFDHTLSIAGADKVETKGGLTTYTYDVKDRNAVSNLGGGDPVCGQLAFNVYAGAPASASLSAEAAALDGTRVIVSAAKLAAARQLIGNIDNWLNTVPFPMTANDLGWDLVDSSTFNAMVNTAEGSVLTNINIAMTNAQTAMAAGVMNPGGVNMSNYFAEGWAMAGGWWQKTAALRTEANKIIQETGGTVSSPPLNGLPGDGRTTLLQSTVNIADAILRRSQSRANYQTTAISRPEDIASVVPDSSATSIDTSTINQELNNRFSSIINNGMASVVGFATGTGASPGVHPIDRMKMIGDSLAATKTVLNAALFSLRAGLTAVRTVAGGVSAGKVLGSGFELDKLFTPFWDFVNQAVAPLIADALSWLDVLIYYFSVMLPSLPYIIYMTAVAGWLLAVLQTCIAGSLWLVMHMRPSQTFVGSDAQGYLLLLALFVRPALAVIGLFAAFLASDPILDYVSKGFFSIRGAVNSDTGIIGWLAEWSTFKMWLGAFAITTLPIAYMLFGLPQTLPDHVLRWISAGVHDLGATNASAEAQRGMANTGMSYRGSSLKSSGRNSAEGRHLPPPAGSSGGGGPAIVGPSGSRGGSGYERQGATLSANPEGVTPQLSAPGGSDSGSGAPRLSGPGSGSGTGPVLSASSQGSGGSAREAPGGGAAASGISAGGAAAAAATASAPLRQVGPAASRKSESSARSLSGPQYQARLAQTVGFALGMGALAAAGRVPGSSVRGGAGTAMQRIGQAYSGGSAGAIRKLNVDHRRDLGPAGRAEAAGRTFPQATGGDSAPSASAETSNSADVPSGGNGGASPGPDSSPAPAGNSMTSTQGVASAPAPTEDDLPEGATPPARRTGGVASV